MLLPTQEAAWVVDEDSWDITVQKGWFDTHIMLNLTRCNSIMIIICSTTSK